MRLYQTATSGRTQTANFFGSVPRTSRRDSIAPMRAVITTAVLCLGLVVGRAQTGGDHQVAVVLDTTLLKAVYHWDSTTRTEWTSYELEAHVRGEINAFENALREAEPTVDVAVVHQEDDAVIDHPFGSGNRGVANALATLASTDPHLPASVDLVTRSLDELKWRDGADKRVVVIGSYGHVLSPGRTKLEEVMHAAERKSIVVHALEFVAEPYLNKSAVAALVGDVYGFFVHPTWPLGRVVTHPRHGTLISGWSYRLVLSPIDQALDYALENRDRYPSEYHERYVQRALAKHLEVPPGLLEFLERAHGPLTNGRDVLDDLADGLLRPNEVKAGDVPAALAGIDLEPLLDAVWDFVDARRLTVAVALHKNRDQSGRIRLSGAGAALGRELLEPRRKMPSRR